VRRLTSGGTRAILQEAGTARSRAHSRSASTFSRMVVESG